MQLKSLLTLLMATVLAVSAAPAPVAQSNTLSIFGRKIAINSVVETAHASSAPATSAVDTVSTSSSGVVVVKVDNFGGGSAGESFFRGYSRLETNSGLAKAW